MSRDMLSYILHELDAGTAEIRAAAVISNDGLILASLFSAGLDANRIGATGAAMHSLAKRMTEALGYGELAQLLVQSEGGYILLRRAGNHAVLCVCTSLNARLDWVFQETWRAAEAIEKIL